MWLDRIFKYKAGSSTLPSEAELENMTDSLSHRGPNDRGTFYAAEDGLGMGHRRLSIRDLSPLGAQPMSSSCGRFRVVYNGEIYTTKEVASKLANAGRYPKGSSDTELLTESLGEWGVEATLPNLNGMFAFAAFDNKSKILYLVRDRIGIKPLYWGCLNGLLIFSSELKAFKHLKVWQPEIDINSVASFMRHNYIASPNSIYKNIYKLAPGTILAIKKGSEPN